jgi:predicted dehydrogenase
VPAGLDWDGWLGVASERPYIDGYYHPGNWRKRLDFGTGTFGDMGCHILDPVYAALALTAPTSVRSEGDAPNDDSWGLNTLVKYTFPETKYTTKEVSLTWYNGELRPDKDLVKKLGIEKLADQGSILIGSEATMYCPYIGFPILLPGEKFAAVRLGRTPGDNHYLQFVEAARGNGTTSTPFSYSGPLTESVLLGCLATRFPKTTLNWDAEKLKFTNEEKANQFVRRDYRKGYGAEGL